MRVRSKILLDYSFSCAGIGFDRFFTLLDFQINVVHALRARRCRKRVISKAKQSARQVLVAVTWVA